ncbi:rhodanese-like domain-containing protein [Algoriphagus sp. CAU 1675]|uniref:rhodanese-like domain-containing protein n=1 Tax=Algoriphagus sp. CAU 1675 TaxID=3032597 RepID=UPI0023DC9656|nr:rhodanese-like domain-containing protein [Algoriphagus sp. CAU 1675]MDF2157596.1 rhodanese-like domain-containing protein [Algoriphagus sp. CAU 1675]
MKKLSLLLFLSIALLSCNSKSTESSTQGSESTPTQGSFIQSVDATTFKKLVESGNGIILDVRTPGEVAQGYIPNATVIDIYRQDFMEKIAELPKDKEVYVYCSAGVRSMQAAKILQRNGYEKVYSLEDGLGTWVRSGYPLTK